MGLRRVVYSLADRIREIPHSVPSLSPHPLLSSPPSLPTGSLAWFKDHRREGGREGPSEQEAGWVGHDDDIAGTTNTLLLGPVLSNLLWPAPSSSQSHHHPRFSKKMA